jgi:hypothetical protein
MSNAPPPTLSGGARGSGGLAAKPPSEYHKRHPCLLNMCYPCLLNEQLALAHATQKWIAELICSHLRPRQPI